ncbi:MAG: squalene/phytoene synthase family protein [Acetobacter indonesiensis]|nr:squalene/phytoene synthase family protein [Acetobacter indonesiensis]MCI1545565.1 squalene/phytoene synthase family protein [Acetobacter indonesiensis]MCI1764698.1 squalene/phytoene synthase family protein [Acetobacter indonesiensis]
MTRNRAANMHLLEERARQADPDRTLCARFLPVGIRPAVWSLILFHDELVRALAPARSAAVAGPIAGFVRLQWWREVLDGQRPPDHELAPAIMHAIEGGVFQQATLLRLIDARETELIPNTDKAAWQSMMRHGAGGVQRAVGEALGVKDEAVLASLEACGAAYGVGAMLRHWPKLQQSGRFLCPEGEDGLKEAGQVFLAQAKVVSFPKETHVAFLPSILAKRDLARGSQQAGQPRGLGDRMAVMKAGFFGG